MEGTEVVKHLRSGKVPWIDEIQPEMLKALGVEGLSWLTRLFNIAWEYSAKGVANWGGDDSPVQKRGQEILCQLLGYHTSQPPW